MLDLQQCLKREANAQTGARGLEPGEDLQVNCTIPMYVYISVYLDI